MKRYLFIALGNPGNEYSGTRHNAGWIALDALLETWRDPSIPLVWKHEKKIHSLVTKIQVGPNEIIALKPQTFMNRSGEAAKAALAWYTHWNDEGNENEEFPSLVIFHDDLDLETGQYKLKYGSGPQIHNGINSIRSHLHSNKFWYARLGIDSRNGNRTISGEAYVLQRFSSDELSQLKQVIRHLAAELEYTVFS
jgi:PTH1 family peptidyl-tRNA hydrolase